MLLSHLISHFFTVVFCMKFGQREQTGTYPPHCHWCNHIITYLLIGYPIDWSECYTQSSQNQSMQWFTELLRHVGRAVTFRRLWVKFLCSGLWPRTKHAEFPERHHKYLFKLQRAVGSVTNSTLLRLCTVYSATGSCRRWRWKRVSVWLQVDFQTRNTFFYVFLTVHFSNIWFHVPT